MRRKHGEKGPLGILPADLEVVQGEPVDEGVVLEGPGNAESIFSLSEELEVSDVRMTMIMINGLEEVDVG